MKKLVLLVVVVGGLGYLSKSLKRAQESVAERNATLQGRVPEVPQPGAVQVPLKGDPLEDRLKVLRQRDSIADERFTWELQYGAACTEAYEKLASIRMSEERRAFQEKLASANAPGVSKPIPISEAARASARVERAETEKFVAEHCGQWRIGRRP